MVKGMPVLPAGAHGLERAKTPARGPLNLRNEKCDHENVAGSGYLYRCPQLTLVRLRIFQLYNEAKAIRTQ